MCHGLRPGWHLEPRESFPNHLRVVENKASGAEQAIEGRMIWILAAIMHLPMPIGKAERNKEEKARWGNRRVFH
jgi:hypothetical protein